MPIQFQCLTESCGPLRAADSAAGSRIKCPRCGALQMVPGQEGEDAPIPIEERSALTTEPSPPRRRSVVRHRDDDDEDDRDRRPRRSPVKRRSGAGLGIALLLGAGGLLFLFCAGAGVGAYVYFTRNRDIPAAEWRDFSPPGSECVVRMPGEPQPMALAVNGVNGKKFVLERKRDNMVFALAYIDLPRGSVGPALLQQMANAERDAVARAMAGRGTNESAITLPVSAPDGVRNCPGREFHIEVTGQRGRGIERIYAVDLDTITRVYIVMIAGPRIEPNKGDAETFFRSFKVTAQLRGPLVRNDPPPIARPEPQPPPIKQGPPILPPVLPDRPRPPRRKRPPPPVDPVPAPRPDVKTIDARSTFTLPVNHTANSLLFLPDGRSLVSAGNGRKPLVWDLGTGAHRDAFAGRLPMSGSSLTMSKDGKTMAVRAGSMALVWGATTGAEGRTFRETTSGAVALTADGKAIATAGFRALHIWDTGTGNRLQEMRAHTSWIEGLAFSPDGRLLASSSRDRTIGLWDARTGASLTIWRSHTQPVNKVAFSPDGKLLASVSHDRTIKLWDVETRNERATLTGHLDAVTAVAFSPDGRYLATGGGGAFFGAGTRGEVKVWEVATGKEKAELRGLSGGVFAVAFAPDGKTVAASASGGGAVIKLWDVTSVVEGKKD